MMLALSFTNISDFIHMGGYGGYVWSAYGLVALGLLLQILKRR